MSAYLSLSVHLQKMRVPCVDVNSRPKSLTVFAASPSFNATSSKNATAPVQGGQIAADSLRAPGRAKPHLHMHIVDEPSFLARYGIRTNSTTSTRVDRPSRSQNRTTRCSFAISDHYSSAHNDYPANNAAVTFP